MTEVKTTEITTTQGRGYRRAVIDIYPGYAIIIKGLYKKKCYKAYDCDSEPLGEIEEKVIKYDEINIVRKNSGEPKRVEFLCNIREGARIEKIRIEIIEDTHYDEINVNYELHDTVECSYG